MSNNELTRNEPVPAAELMTPVTHNGEPQVPHAPVASGPSASAADVNGFSPQSITGYDSNSDAETSDQDDPTLAEDFAVRTLDFSNC